VPLLGLFVRRRVAATTWAGAGLASVGLYFLSTTSSFEVNRGDWFVLACAFFWAVHVLIIGSAAPRTDPLKLAALQFAIGSVLALIAALLTEEITGTGIAAARWAILYSGALSVAVAFTLQVVAQRGAPPAHAAVLLSLEAVFAALAGWLVLSETLGRREAVGCMLMLAGFAVSQIRRSDRTVPVP
jgi:drug/metabolite transporter (DMT)-like permease